MAPPSGKAKDLGAVMALVHINPCNSARTRIEVLVGTPYRKIHTPVVELKGYVAHGMREVPAHDHAFGLRCCRDLSHRVGPAGEVVHAAHQ